MEVMNRLEEIKAALLANGASDYVAKCNDMDKLFKYIKDNFIYLSMHNILTPEIINSNVKFEEHQIFANCNNNTGYVLVTDTTVAASGDAKVCAINNAKVIASENAVIHAFNDVEVISYSAWVIAKEYSYVQARSYSHVDAYDNTDIDAYDNSCIVSYGETNIHAHDNVHIMLHNSDYVWATDNVFIKSLFKPKKMCLRNAAINYAQQEHKVYYSSSSPLKFEPTK